MKLNELMKEYRESLETPVVPDFEVLLQRRRRRLWLPAWAAVAAAFAVAVFWPWPASRPVDSTREIPMAAVAVPAQDAPVDAALKVAPVKARAVQKAVASRRAIRDDLAGFVAIAETSMLPQPQVLQVLRVYVSGNRLAALGVLRPNQVIRPNMIADVLLGDDGMARAIRVVAEE